MRIANWNLQRVHPSESRAELILKQLKLVEADIWVLTETHELIGPGELYSSVMSGKHEAESQPGEHWAGIWSHFPMKHLPSFVSDGSRCTAALVSHPQIGDVTVYATVMPWVGSTWRDIESTDGAAFEAALNAYKLDWQKLRAAFPHALHIVAGDFNQDFAPYHYYGSNKQRGLLRRSLTDSHSKIATVEIDVAHRQAGIDTQLFSYQFVKASTPRGLVTDSHFPRQPPCESYGLTA